MKSKTKEISVSIDSRDALSIINCLRKGLGNNEHMDKKDKDEPARNLLKLLDANFNSSVHNIHFN